MYESHFGLSGPPFQLIPDPSFYFDSRGHANALAYLKFGVYQGEGFIVVTGEIGAGKTTLLRTLLGGINREQLVAANIVSTQLESGELLRAIVSAFGITTAAQHKADLLLALESFLTALAAKGRRALLVVDEAQNLSLQAIEELRMLSNFQLGNHALLQSFLVGQPELRTMLESPSMEQLRQRVIASCHLGPMDIGETRAYVEHRLTKAGWSGNPLFEAEAFDQVYHWTGGVPRRINLLCNRLLLGCFLGGLDRVTADMVKRIATELRTEVGELNRLPTAPMTIGTPAPEATGPVAARPAAPVAGGLPVVSETSRARLRGLLSGAAGPLLILADSHVGRLKAGTMVRAMMGHAKLPPVLVVNLAPADPASADDARAGLPVPPLEVRLGSEPGSSFAAVAAELLMKFDAIIDEAKPAAVMSMGSSDGELACALLARKRGLRLVRVEAGTRRADPDSPEGFNAAMLDRLADLLYTNKLTAHYTLYREGIPAEQVHQVGALMPDLLCLAMPQAVDPAVTLADAGAGRSGLRPTRGFALVTLPLGVDAGGQQRDHAGNIVGLVRAISAELPVIWVMGEADRAAMHAQRFDVALRQDAVTIISTPSYVGLLGLLGQARLLLCGVDRLMLEEAEALGRPFITAGVSISVLPDESLGKFVGLDVGRALRAVREVLERPPVEDGTTAFTEGETSNRIAEHLRGWLPKRWRNDAARAALSKS